MGSKDFACRALNRRGGRVSLPLPPAFAQSASGDPIKAEPSFGAGVGTPVSASMGPTVCCSLKTINAKGASTGRSSSSRMTPNQPRSRSERPDLQPEGHHGIRRLTARRGRVGGSPTPKVPQMPTGLGSGGAEPGACSRCAARAQLAAYSYKIDRRPEGRRAARHRLRQRDARAQQRRRPKDISCSENEMARPTRPHRPRSSARSIPTRSS